MSGFASPADEFPLDGSMFTGSKHAGATLASPFPGEGDYRCAVSRAAVIFPHDDAT
jgi:hypothetical protein